MIGRATALAALTVAGSASAQIQVNRPCNALLVKSSAHDVTVNCGIVSPQLQNIAHKLNALIKESNFSERNSSELVALINQVFVQDSDNFGALIRRTDVLEQKADKILQLLQSVGTDAGEAKTVLTRISANALSYARVSGPITLQIVGAYYGNYNNIYSSIRFVFRISENSDDKSYAVAVKSNYSVGGISYRTIANWTLLGDKGTSCLFSPEDPGMTIAAGTYGALDANIREKGNFRDQMPTTVIVNALCTDLVRNEPLDLTVRLYYKDVESVSMNPKSDDSLPWSVATFRFGGVVPSNRGEFLPN